MPKHVTPPRYTFTSAISFFNEASFACRFGCGMVLMINKDHFLSCGWVVGKGATKWLNLLHYGVLEFHMLT